MAAVDYESNSGKKLAALGKKGRLGYNFELPEIQFSQIRLEKFFMAKKKATKNKATTKKATKKAAENDGEGEVKKKKKRKTRSKTPEVIRKKLFWGVFNHALKRVALYEFNQRKAAEKRAKELSPEGKPPHFVQKVKEEIVEVKEAKKTAKQLKEEAELEAAESGTTKKKKATKKTKKKA
ncbi:MAG: hypothetical protein AAF623_01310 [Planctomycetota bacterium]